MDKELVDKLVTLRNGNKIIVDGSLGKLYSESLDELFKKEIEPNTGIAIESQIFQTINGISLSDDDKEELNKQSVGLLYCVPKIDVVVNDLQKISRYTSGMNDKQLLNTSVVIIPDDTQVEGPALYAVENYCKKIGIKIHSSFESYFESRKKK